MKYILLFIYLCISSPIPAQTTTDISILSLPWLSPSWLIYKKLYTTAGLGESFHNARVSIFGLPSIGTPSPDAIQAISTIKDPVTASLLVYCKLHNETVDRNSMLSNGIRWDYLLIRFHQNKPENNNGIISGYYFPDKGIADYQCYKAFKAETDAFIGTWSKNNNATTTINWHRVDANGDWQNHKKEGYEYFTGILRNGDPTICGVWKGYASALSKDMRDQFGSMKLLNQEIQNNGKFHKFKMKALKPEWDNANKVEGKIDAFNNMATIFGSLYSAYMFTFDDQEQIVAYYVNQAWDKYKDQLPASINKTDVTKNFDVHLSDKLSSPTQQGGEVPAQFGPLYDGVQGNLPSGTNSWQLRLSYDFFINTKTNNGQTRTAAMAHEVLGHGIPHRYYHEPIFYEKPSGHSIKTLKSKLEVRRYSEGLAVCVEYRVLKNLGATPFQTVMDFASKGKYSADKSPCKIYSPGVSRILTDNIASNDGEIDWLKLKKLHENLSL